MAITERIATPKSEALKPMLWYLGITLAPLAAASYSGNERVLNWMLGLRRHRRRQLLRSLLVASHLAP